MESVSAILECNGSVDVLLRYDELSLLAYTVGLSSTDVDCIFGGDDQLEAAAAAAATMPSAVPFLAAKVE